MNFRLLIIFGTFFSIAAQAITNLKLGSTLSRKNAVCNSYTYFKTTVVNACKDLVISFVWTKGEGDLFVRKSSDVPVYPTYEMLSWGLIDDNVLRISHWEPAFSVGDFYIGVYADCKRINSPLDFSISASEGEDDSGDILKYPALGLNKIVNAQGHTYFRFCVPYECNTVKINYNTGNTSIAPTLVMSRRQPKANVKNNLFRAWLTSLVTSPTDPTARDDNGYLSGAYYVGVYGWCTPVNLCPDPSYCYPCNYYGKGVPVNVSVEVTELGEGNCSTIAYVREDPDTITIQSGVTYTGKMKCKEDRFFKIAVPEPCYNLNIISSNPGAKTCCQSGDIYIGKWPTTRPFYQNRGWNDFFWGKKNITLSAFDPTFSGGYNCGMDGKSLCVYYIQINAWCDEKQTPSDYLMNYTLTATLERAHAIFGVPQTNQKLLADEAVNNYQFCIPEASNVLAQLNSIQDTCALSSSNYEYYDMIISPNLPNPPENSLVWRAFDSNSISLTTDLPSFRTGQFYVNIIGHCNTSVTSAGAATCKANSCSCGSCATLQTPYSLTVDWATSFPPPPVPSLAPTSGTILSVTRLSSLNEGQVAGIVIGLIFENILLIGLIVCFMRSTFCVKKQRNYEAGDGVASGGMDLSPLAGHVEDAPSRPYRTA